MATSSIFQANRYNSSISSVNCFLARIVNLTTIKIANLLPKYFWLGWSRSSEENRRILITICVCPQSKKKSKDQLWSGKKNFWILFCKILFYSAPVRFVPFFLPKITNQHLKASSCITIDQLMTRTNKVAYQDNNQQ